MPSSYCASSLDPIAPWHGDEPLLAPTCAEVLLCLVRWVRGQTGDGFLDASRLPECYSTQVQGGYSGSTPRTPSYTDRIMLHSLPDMAARAQILAYDSCDVITGSDHRPVAARMHMLVDRRVRGFGLGQPTPANRTRGTRSIGRGGSQGGEEVQARSLRSGSFSGAGEGEVEGAGGAEAALPPMCLPRLAAPASLSSGPRGVAHYEGPVAVWQVTLSRLVFTWQGTVVDAPEVSELMCLFPLPTEDPWASDRKSVALDEVRDIERKGRTWGPIGHVVVLSRLEWCLCDVWLQSLLPLLRSKSLRASSVGSAVASHVSGPSLDNVHRLAYPPTPCTEDSAVTIQALVAPAFCRHLLIKFLDAKVCTTPARRCQNRKPLV